MRECYAHCAQIVRTADKDRYLATLFVPEPARSHVFALYAFNNEVAAVRERARQPLAGEIRLQWWRDVLEGRAAGEAARNPVAAALLDTLDRHRLPRGVLAALIDAREFDLYDDPMGTDDAYDEYVRATSSSLFALITRLLAGADAAGPHDAAGLAYGTTGLLRAFALHASRGQIYLPAELLDRCGVTRADILAGVDTPALRVALDAMRNKAAGHLAAANAQLPEVPMVARPAFLSLALVDGYLARMQRSDYQPFRTPVEVPQWRRQWALWRAARSSMITRRAADGPSG